MNYTIETIEKDFDGSDVYESFIANDLRDAQMIATDFQYNKYPESFHLVDSAGNAYRLTGE